VHDRKAPNATSKSPDQSQVKPSSNPPHRPAPAVESPQGPQSSPRPRAGVAPGVAKQPRREAPPGGRMTTPARGTIAVLGATGRMGGATARHLLEDGWQVRAITRKPDGPKARALAAAGAQVVKADMEDPAALRKAFEGAQGVFNVQNPMKSGLEAEVRQGRNVADAAADAGA